jgi:hypothetical protein
MLTLLCKLYCKFGRIKARYILIIDDGYLTLDGSGRDIYGFWTYSYCLFGVRNRNSSSADVLNLGEWLPPREKKGIKWPADSEANAALRRRAVRREVLGRDPNGSAASMSPTFGFRLMAG